MKKLAPMIGFGGWGLGGKAPGILGYGPIDNGKAEHLVSLAIKKGITFFDTAPAYGDGTSEKIIGEAANSQRHKVFLATKVGASNFRNKQNFQLDEIKKSLEESLIRLKTEYLDLVQLHDPESVKKIPGVLDFLLERKAKGEIKNIGVSLKNPLDFDEWAQYSDIDFFQLNLSALDQRLLSTSVAKVAEKRGVKVIARTALCFGFLTDMPPVREELDDSDHRRRWSDEQFNEWIVASNKVFDGVSVESKTEAAIRFCLSFPWVHVVLTGIMNERDIDSNIDIETRGPLPAKDVELIINNYLSAADYIPKLNNI